MKGQTDIGKIYDDYSVRLYNIGLRIVGDASDAEEIMHDTLLFSSDYAERGQNVIPVPYSIQYERSK